MRFTVHSYAGFWWIRDNVKGVQVYKSNGSMLTYHPRNKQSWESSDKARQAAQRKADKLNAEANQ